MRSRSFIISIVVLFSLSFVRASDIETSPRIIETIYGSQEVYDEVLLELFDCDAVQRLKNIDQYGSVGVKSFSRYDHSVGVWFLLAKFGASREEQIAGLLHDASHTIFSHVGDKVFRFAEKKDSYQDRIHMWWLSQTTVPMILEKYGIPFESIDHKSPRMRLLERDLPDICVDRLEYNLRGGLVEGLITQEEVDQILEDVAFENGIFFFTKIDIAKKFAEIPLYLTEYVWGSHKDFVSQIFLAHALRKGVELKIISNKEILFSTDDIVFNKLRSSTDRTIAQDLTFYANCESLYSLESKENSHKSFVCKFRGVDPWIKMPNGRLRRLTEVDKSFMQYYTLVKELMARGFDIKIKSPVILGDVHYFDDLFLV